VTGRSDAATRNTRTSSWAVAIVLGTACGAVCCTAFCTAAVAVAATATATVAAAGAGTGTVTGAEAQTPQGEMQVRMTLDAAGQSGAATAAVRIHAHPETIWPFIATCAEALHIVPGLVGCTVERTAADGSQIIRHTLDYSWYVPRLNYVVRATFDKPKRVSIERVSGDLALLTASWTLERDGDTTVVHYEVALAPGFWVPHWVIRAALRHDLPRMLRALRMRAEATEAERAG
jgi:hypothetical protein